MQYDDVVMGRRSARGFLKKPVLKDVIKEVIGLAMRAPSSFNTQPWNMTVVSGDALDEIRKGNVERNMGGVPHSREIRVRHAYDDGPHRTRQIEVAKQLFGVMGIERHDKDARNDWILRGFRQFDAPVSIVITYDRSVHGDDVAPFDCGGLANAIVNAAWSRGLGCVINSQGIMQTPVVREHGQIAEDQVIMICIAMGYPDDSFPANAVVTNRKPIEEAVTFVGFED